MRCQGCGGVGALLHTIAIVNIDPDSLNEGEHRSDTDIRICDDCLEVVREMVEDVHRKFCRGTTRRKKKHSMSEDL